MRIQIYTFLLFTLITAERILAVPNVNDCRDIFGNVLANCLQPQVNSNNNVEEIVVNSESDEATTENFAGEIVNEAIILQQQLLDNTESEADSTPPTSVCDIFTNIFPFFKNNAVEEVKECSICLEQIRDDCYVTECSHHFHGECIRQVKNRCNGSVQNRCPVCRAAIAHPDDRNLFKRTTRYLAGILTFPCPTVEDVHELEGTRRHRLPNRRISHNRPVTNHDFARARQQYRTDLARELLQTDQQIIQLRRALGRAHGSRSFPIAATLHHLEIHSRNLQIELERNFY